MRLTDTFLTSSKFRITKQEKISIPHNVAEITHCFRNMVDHVCILHAGAHGLPNDGYDADSFYAAVCHPEYPENSSVLLLCKYCNGIYYVELTYFTQM